MKTNYFVTFTVLLLLSCTSVYSATIELFEMDGIHYAIKTSDTTDYEGEKAWVTSTNGRKANETNAYTGNIVIPSEVTHNGVTYSVIGLATQAFWYCRGIKSLTLSEGIIYISGAFYNTEIEELNLPSTFRQEPDLMVDELNGITSFWGFAGGCLGLKKMVVADDNPVYDSREGCNAIIETATNTLLASCEGTVIPSSVEKIAAEAFSHSVLTEIVIPEGVKALEASVFRDCVNLKSMSFPESVTEINGYSLFEGDSCLQEVTFPMNASFTDIVGSTFRDCINLTTINNFPQCPCITDVPNSSAIWNDAFHGCVKLKLLEIPVDITWIGRRAFMDCKSLESFVIPEKVDTLCTRVFDGCEKLKTLKVLAINPPKIAELQEDELFQRTILVVPEGSEDAYRQHEVWGKFQYINAPDYTLGDANGDNKVNGTDIVVIANMVLGRKDKNAAADSNQDGKVNGTDIVVVANIVLGRSSAPVRKAPAVTVSGSATLSIKPFSITAGSEATMTIDLNNPDDELTLVQFDLTLPKGLSIKTVGGDFDIDMAGRTTWRKHSLDANLNDGYYTFLLKSDSNTPISGTEGGIITVTLVADATFTGGKIVIDNTVLTTPNEVEINPARYEYSLGGDEPTPVPDGTCLFIEPFSITAGSEATMTVDLNNADDVITLVQFDLTLPQGLSIKTVGGDFDIDMAGRTTWRKHSLDANLNDGYYTFLLKSDSNTPIDGTSGGIITVTLVADATFTGGKIVVDNTVLTTPEEVEINPARYEYSLEGATAIEGVEVEKTDDCYIYDLSGRRVEYPTQGIHIIDGRKVMVK